MKNFDEKLTQQKTAADIAAINEGTIRPVELLQEILPILEDYFIGKFTMKDNALQLSFQNGQNIRLVAGAVC